MINIQFHSLLNSFAERNSFVIAVHAVYWICLLRLRKERNFYIFAFQLTLFK